MRTIPIAHEAPIMAGLVTLQECRLDMDTELSDSDLARFNLHFQPELRIISLADTIKGIYQEASDLTNTYNASI